MPLVIFTGPLLEYLYDFDFQPDKQQETDFGILIKAALMSIQRFMLACEGMHNISNNEKHNPHLITLDIYIMFML